MDHVDHYREHGYAIIRNVCAPERIAALREVVEDVALRQEPDLARDALMAFLQTENVQVRRYFHPGCRRGCR